MLRYMLLAVLCMCAGVSAAPGYLGGSPLLSHGALYGGHASLLDGHALAAPAYSYGHSPGLALAHAPIAKYEAAPAISYAAPIAKYAAPALAAPLSLGYKSISAGPAYSYGHAHTLPLSLGHSSLGHLGLGHPGLAQYAYGHGPALALGHHAAGYAYGHEAALAHGW